jgi:teichoic acid transport system permease protein
MDDLRRLSGPGALGHEAMAVLTPSLSDGLVPGAGDDLVLPDEPLAALATRHGLRSTAARPSLPAYVGLLWQRRHFIAAYATARNIATFSEARLGQLWQVLTPLLNAGVYYLVFGVIFGARRGVPNYPAFLVTGIFVFSFTERSILAGSRVMANNVSLIRAMYFPWACLPLAYGVVELQQMLLSMLVLFAIVIGTGEPVTWYWLMLIPVLLLQTMFNLGAALILARMGAQVRDVSQLVPFLLRTWRYFCGVMYSIAVLPVAIPVWAKAILAGNPAATYITLTRLSLLASERTAEPGAKPYNFARCKTGVQAYCHAPLSLPHVWESAIGWAVVTLAVGIVYFWQAETRYGRG